MEFIMRVLLLVMKDRDSMFEKNPELIARIKKTEGFCMESDFDTLGSSGHG